MERMVDGLVFVTGVLTEMDTFSVNPGSGEVKELCQLQTHRSNMGRYSEDIYSFGGSHLSDDMRCSEVFTNAQQHWQYLPDCNHPRFSFTPTEYRGNIYLLGGCKSAPCEYFSVASSTFHDLPLLLPGENCAIAICTGSQILAVQQDRHYACSRENPLEWEMVMLGFDLEDGFWSSSRVIEANGFYLYSSEQSE